MNESNQPATTPTKDTIDGTDPKNSKGFYKSKGKHDGSKKKRNEENKRNAFVGDTPEMLGHVFQVSSEQRKRGQFQDTLDQLKIYASTNYKKEIKHMRRLFMDIESPQIKKPKPPKVVKKRTTRSSVTTRGQRQTTDTAATTTEDDGSEDNLDTAIYAEEVKTYVKEKRNLEAALASLFNIVWGQCSRLMKHRIMASEDYDQKEEDGDVAWLLREVRQVSNEMGTNVSVYYAQHEAIKRFYTYYQNEEDNIATHLKNFKSMIAIVEHYGGDIFYDESLADYEREMDKKNGQTTRSDKEYQQLVRDRKMAMAFLLSANRKKYGTLLDKLSDSFSFNMDVYPKTLNQAYELLVKHTSSQKPFQKHRPKKSEGKRQTTNTSSTKQNDEGNALTFAQSHELVAGNNGKVIAKIKCFRCNRYGHYADQCPLIEEEEQHHNMHEGPSDDNGEESDQMVQHMREVSDSSDSDDDSVIVSFIHAMNEESTNQGAENQHAPSTDILLDTGSTCSVFSNDKMLINIRKAKKKLVAKTNGGPHISDMEGELPGFFTVWFNPKSMINILSFADVRKRFRITIDTNEESCFLVHTGRNKPLRFNEVETGLYLFDKNEYMNERRASGYSFLTLAEDTEGQFSKEEISRAERAIVLHKNLGYPSYQEFFRLVQKRYIIDCPVTVDDVKLAIHLYGPSNAMRKGKTTCKRSSSIKVQDQVKLPMSIKERHKNVTLGLDFLYVNGIMFLHSIARKFKFRTIEVFYGKRKLKAMDTLASIMKIINIYKSRNLNVIQIDVDMEFKSLESQLLPIKLNVAAADEHVPDVERSIRTIKEGTRSILHGLPFDFYHQQLVAGCVQSVVKALNNTPKRGGLSDVLSPSTLVTGTPPPNYNTITKLSFGEYVEVKENNSFKNSMDQRTVGALAMYPSGNVQGTWYFWSLETGKTIHRKQWVKVPITREIIQRVNKMGLNNRQKKIGGNFKYTKGFNAETEEDVSDSDEHEDNESEADTIQSDESVGVNMNDDESVGGGSNQSQNDEDQSLVSEHENEIVEKNNDITSSDRVLRPRTRRIDYSMYHKYEDAQLLQIEKEVITKLCNSSKSKKNKGKTDKKKARKLKVKQNDMFRKVLGTVMTQIARESKHAQVNVREGIKRYGDKAVEAIFKEYAQLNEKGTFEPENPNMLSENQKKEALNLITIVKEKRCGKIKGRACADGRKQRRYISKEEASSPTIQMESLILSLLIDAKERRDVATADVVGAYLLTDMHEYTLVKLTSDATKIMCEVNNEYKNYVTTENNKPVLYLKLKKALYGCIMSALLWYQTFVGVLMDLGFTLNEYDPCVANLEVEGSQCTVCWYVDDNKISHKSPKIVDWVIKELEKRFDKMTVTRGKKHSFVGMDIVFRDDGKFEMTMKDYLKESIEAFDEKVSRGARTPARGNLFDEDDVEDREQLTESAAEVFHHIVAKLLYVAKRARPDIDLAVSFLCTRVASPTKGDKKKLKRLLEYVSGTLDMIRIIGWNGNEVLQTWVDASYAVHRDMRSHTGAAMSLGHGTIHHRSAKQKLNTKSSTEAELVGASEYIGWTLFAKRFLEKQGYNLKRNIFYQDNESAMKLERNGKASSSNKTRHIHIRYFFVHDVLNQEDIELKHCKTDEMVADFYTKPLQGKQFLKLRDIIMGHVPITN